MAANAQNKVTTKGASIGINYYPNSDISLSELFMEFIK